MCLCLTDQVAGWGLLVSTESNLWSINYVSTMSLPGSVLTQQLSPSSPQKGFSLFSHVRCEDSKKQDVDGP